MGGTCCASRESKGRSRSGAPPGAAPGAPIPPGGAASPASTGAGNAGARLVAEHLRKVEELRAKWPENRCLKYLTRDVMGSYSSTQQEVLVAITKTGVDNPDSSLGCYAMQPLDYDEYARFFDPLIRDYHKAGATAKHVTDWDASDVGEQGVLDVGQLGLSELSMRVRVGRNLANFNLPGRMSREERIRFEKTMLAAFAKLQGMSEYGGHVYSLTPDFGEGEANPHLISQEKYEQLVEDHIMFKDMAADPYLASAGISRDWPYGRGCYVSRDGHFIIWFGEEDQLRIMCMKKGTKLNEVFDRLREGLKVVESIPGITFAASKDYGYVTSCPSNLGTGMRASVHVKIPKLTADGTDAKAKAVCKPLGLSVRGTGGEHTPIGKDGTVDISPSARLFIREKDIIAALYKGIELLMENERAA
jgi:protein-arginine kinase